MNAGADRSDLLVLLRDRFGFDRLTSAQSKVIDKLLDGHNVLAVLPTGSGKSLCYQLTSQLLPGITVVVSPLVALMKDQCDSLARKGIAAARLDASVDAGSERHQISALRSGTAKLLYVSPERCFNERFEATLQSLSISLLAIDEAHCISQWGHQFRPDYRRLPEFVARWNIPQTLALTATASRSVIAEIRSDLKIDRGHVVKTSVIRPNLRLRCIDVSRTSRDDVLLQQLCSPRLGSTIVYVTRRRDAERIAGTLQAAGLAAAAYHAGLPRETRDEVQNHFLLGSILIVVATVAFGMGVDKSNVRNVIHYNLSSSVESYTQEIGRAGRDSKPSICQTLLDPSDRVAIENLAYSDLPTQTALTQLISTLHGQPDEFIVSHTKLAWECNMSVATVASLLVRLSATKALMPLSARYDTYHVTVRYSSQAMINRCEPSQRESVRAIVDSLIKSKRGHRLNLVVTSRQSGIDRQRLMQTLDEMASNGWIDVKVGDLMHGYRWIDRPKSLKRWADRQQRELLSRIETNQSQIDKLLNILRCNECLVIGIADHFGQTKRVPCRKCTACLGDGPIRISDNTATQLGSSATAYGRSARAKFPEPLADPIDASKFLCGLYTPETTRRKLHHEPGFGCCEDVPFRIVLNEIASGWKA